MVIPNCAEKGGERKDQAQNLNSQLKHPINNLKPLTSALKEPLFPIVAEMKLLKIKPRTSSWEWLNYNANWIPNLTDTAAKIRTLTGIKWYPQNGNGDIGRAPDEAGEGKL